MTQTPYSSSSRVSDDNDDWVSDDNRGHCSTPATPSHQRRNISSAGLVLDSDDPQDADEGNLAPSSPISGEIRKRATTLGADLLTWSTMRAESMANGDKETRETIESLISLPSTLKPAPRKTYAGRKRSSSSRFSQAPHQPDESQASSSRTTSKLREAIKETNQGLKGKGKGKGKGKQVEAKDTEGPGGKEAEVEIEDSKKESKDDTGRGTAKNIIKFGELILLPCGVVNTSHPSSSQSADDRIMFALDLPAAFKAKPTTAQITTMHKQGLAIANTDDGLTFRKNHTNRQLTEAFQEMLPQAFQYLLAQGPQSSEASPWLLVSATRSKLELVPENCPNGQELFMTSYRRNKTPFQDITIFIVSRLPIPAETRAKWLDPSLFIYTKGSGKHSAESDDELEDEKPSKSTQSSNGTMVRHGGPRNRGKKKVSTEEQELVESKGEGSRAGGSRARSSRRRAQSYGQWMDDEDEIEEIDYETLDQVTDTEDVDMFMPASPSLEDDFLADMNVSFCSVTDDIDDLWSKKP